MTDGLSLTIKYLREFIYVIQLDRIILIYDLPQFCKISIKQTEIVILKLKLQSHIEKRALAQLLTFPVSQIK